MRLSIRIILLLLLAILISGCARFPTTTIPTDIPTRTLYSEITVSGQIDPNNYYFLAFGVDQTDATGPVPVVTGPELTNGWGTITGLPGGLVQQPPFYVMYHAGSFAQYRGTEYRGTPFRYGITLDNKTLWVEIDQRELDPLLAGVTSPIVQLNWITVQTISVPPSQLVREVYDGFGQTGNNYLHPIPLTIVGSFLSGTLPGSPNYEPTFGPDEPTSSDPNIDISHSIVEVRIQ